MFLKNKTDKDDENTNTRTSLDMDGTLTLISANSVTIQDIITKISASFQLSLK